MNYKQQGDVLLKPSSIPKNLTKMDSNVLQEGEATGHAHRLFDGEYELFQDPKSLTKYLRVITPCLLNHEEHKSFEVPPGEYRIDIVREYDHFKEEARKVID